jgi:GNAT superfamily N-acetyltransferase
MNDYSLIVTDSVDEKDSNAILAPLVEYNARKVGPSGHRLLAVLLKDSGGAIIGGMRGHTLYGWLFTQWLAVPASLRGKCLGKQIMQLAEQEAIARGCHGAWLDTYEFQARGFYERLGYECFGTLADYPVGYSRFFMRKTLAAPENPSK